MANTLQPENPPSKVGDNLLIVLTLPFYIGAVWLVWNLSSMVLQGRGEICVGTERQEITAGQAVFLPPTVFHQLTNIGESPLHMMYIYCPGGDVAHWRQELDGTLPPAGVGATPPLPAGAAPQCTKKPGA